MVPGSGHRARQMVSGKAASRWLAVCYTRGLNIEQKKLNVAGKGGMCGVFGAIETDLTERVLNAAGGALVHRGPDASGTFLDSTHNVGLVHRRLSIVDLQGGDQPLFDHDRSIVLVCNGEIYDFERIRAELKSEGFAFQTASDSEVIINLYLKYGLECLTHLRGEFAFLLLDRNLGRLVAARDRFGIKPLYFARTDSDGWCFASEAKAMAASGLKRLNLDSGNYSLNENCSLFRGVYSVPAATAMVFDLSDWSFTTRTYWRPDFPVEAACAQRTPLNQWVAEVDRSITEAIRLRMRADVPVGVYLSGGIDSAVVAAKVAQIQAMPPLAFTVSFSDVPEQFNEEEKARRIAKHLGLEHHVLKLDTATLWSNLEKCLLHNEAPIGDLAPVAKCMLSALAAEHVKVVLTGEGADEVFLGYRVFNRRLHDTQEHGRHRLSPLRRLWRGDKLRRWLNVSIPGGSPKRGKAAGLDPLLGELPEQSRDTTQLKGRSPVVQLQYRRLKTHLHRVILSAYGDRMEMAHSIEGRVPFLDHCVFALAARIPLAFKIDGKNEKIVLRELASGLVPEEVVNRPKWRFSTPRPTFDLGRHHALDSLVERYLSRAAIRRAGLFTWTSVRVLWGLRRFPRYRAQVDRSLFHILCLQILYYLFVEPTPDSTKMDSSEVTAARWLAPS